MRNLQTNLHTSGIMKYKSPAMWGNDSILRFFNSANVLYAIQTLVQWTLCALIRQYTSPSLVDLVFRFSSREIIIFLHQSIGILTHTPIIYQNSGLAAPPTLDTLLH